MFAGPQLDVPQDVTPAQLETLLNGLLQVRPAAAGSILVGLCMAVALAAVAMQLQAACATEARQWFPPCFPPPSSMPAHLGPPWLPAPSLPRAPAGR